MARKPQSRTNDLTFNHLANCLATAYKTHMVVLFILAISSAVCGAAGGASNVLPFRALPDAVQTCHQPEVET